MRSAAELRLENLETLVKEAGSADALAKTSDLSPEYISQIRNRAIDKKTGKARNLGNQAARKLEKGMGKQEGWMDTSHTPSADHQSSSAEWPFSAKLLKMVQSLSDDQVGELEADMRHRIEAMLNRERRLKELQAEQTKNQSA